jgi:CRP-like cAMP-binding protein
MNEQPGGQHSAIRYLIRSFAARDQISIVEQALLESMPMRFRAFAKGEELVAEQSRATESCLVLRGLTAREVFLKDGSRQITAVHIPGDFVDLHALLLKVMDHSVVALTDCLAAFVMHHEILRVIERSPHLGRLLWLSTVVDAAIQRAWIVSIGRRTPIARLGHLVCELYVRMTTVGLAPRNSFEFPVTQSELADVLGISLVHVNRTLQDLRRTGLMSWKGTTVIVEDFERLAELADFDATYLNIISEPR